jgi:hypothetical protein
MSRQVSSVGDERVSSEITLLVRASHIAAAIDEEPIESLQHRKSETILAAEEKTGRLELR